MAVPIFANDAKTTLAGTLSSSATTISVATGTGALFLSPTSGQFFALTLVDAATQLLYEIVYVTARTGDTMTVMRGQETTNPRAWAIGDFASNNLTAGTIPIAGLSQFTSGSVAGVGYWRKSPDGFIEQWGTATTNSAGAVTITLPIVMATTSYSISMQTGSGPANGDAVNIGGAPNATSFVVSSDTSSGTTPSGPVGFFWKVSGF